MAEASQLCAAKRTDCVLVVDDEEGLSGIFTAKDLAYRVRSYQNIAGCSSAHGKNRSRRKDSMLMLLLLPKS